MKIVVCPLVSRDVPKAIRAVNTARNLIAVDDIQFPVVTIINSMNNMFVDEFTHWCRQNDVDFRVTSSNGTPAKGKNSCLKFLRESDYDGMSMFDGDDMLYPTASLQIRRHLRHHPGTDVLIAVPQDCIANTGSNKISQTVFATCWGSNIFSLKYNVGPGKHSLFDNRNASVNLGVHCFYSKKLAGMVEYDEDQLLGEDLLLEFEMLKLHQECKICFWLGFVSDVMLKDCTGSDNIQSQKNGSDGDACYDRLVRKIPTFLNPERSSFAELPVEFSEMMFSYTDKIAWIKSFAGVCDGLQNQEDSPVAGSGLPEIQESV